MGADGAGAGEVTFLCAVLPFLLWLLPESVLHLLQVQKNGIQWPQMANSGGLIQSCVFPSAPRSIFIHALTHIHTDVHMNLPSCCSLAFPPSSSSINITHIHLSWETWPDFALLQFPWQ